MAESERFTRRHFLTAATAVTGGVGAVAAAVPFVSSFRPSARAQAQGAPVIVSLFGAVPLILVILVVVHIMALHEVGSNNPDGIEIKDHKDASGRLIDGQEVFRGFEQVRPGEFTAQQYDQVVRDIVNFPDYIGDPTQLAREALGVRVIAFLLVFLVIAYLLKQQIWKA